MFIHTLISDPRTTTGLPLPERQAGFIIRRGEILVGGGVEEEGSSEEEEDNTINSPSPNKKPRHE
jgi:hypothetical protein